MDYENLDDLQVPHGNSESVFLRHRAEVGLLSVSGLPPSWGTVRTQRPSKGTSIRVPQG